MVGGLEGWELRGFGYVVRVGLGDYRLRSVFETGREGYRIEIGDQGAEIRARSYVGFVWALETFMQSFTCPKLQSGNCTLLKLPIVI